MARQGKARNALIIALLASVVGDLLAPVALIMLAHPLARFAIGLGPIELAAILVFSLTFIAAVSGESIFKALIARLRGLLLAAHGLDMEPGLRRRTLGVEQRRTTG